MSSRLARCLAILPLSIFLTALCACSPEVRMIGGGNGGPGSGGPSTAANPDDYRLNVGDSAHDLLAADRFDNLVVEIQAVRGYQPTAQAEQKLQDFLAARLNKPAGIRMIIDDPIDSPGKAQLTISDVRAIEDQRRLYFSSGKTIAVYFLALDSGSADDTSSFQILGQAYRNTSMVLYEKSIQANSGAIGKPSTAVLESTILLHETGHILGLVGIGSPLQSQHQDSTHGAHCNNQNCLMYYAVDTTDILANLLGGNVPTLDANCLQDLQANGGK